MATEFVNSNKKKYEVYKTFHTEKNMISKNFQHKKFMVEHPTQKKKNNN